MEGLNKIIGCENPQRVADVVFVHGLDGDAISTWHLKGQPGSFWPRWLGEDAPAVGVWSLGYAVSSSAWRGSTMPLVDRATNALDLLELDGIGSRAVIFVCHSLGGLLVKQMLRHANDYGNADYKRIADSTRAIIFLSTPHSGSNIADWINHLSAILRTTVSVDELEAHHPALRDLNNWYRNHPQTPQIKTLVYCEKRKLGGVLVVNETTADPGIKGVVPIPMDDDHASICKPAERTSQIYRRTLRLVQDIVADIQSTAPQSPAEVAPDKRPGPDLLSDADTAFIGPTERGPIEPALVTTWNEYEDRYGSPLPVTVSFLGNSVRGFFENGGTRAWIVRALGRGSRSAIATIPTRSPGQALVVQAESPGSWANRLLVRITRGSRVGVRLQVLASEAASPPLPGAEFAEDYDNLDYQVGGANTLVGKVNDRSKLIRLSWLQTETNPAEPDAGAFPLAGGADGVFSEAEVYLGSTRAESDRHRGLRALQDFDQAAILCIPDHVHPALAAADQRQITEAAVAACDARMRIVLLTIPGDEDSQEFIPSMNSASAAIYYPWLRVPSTGVAGGVLVPPVGHVAGLLARHDLQRGLHVPPVGLFLHGTVGVHGDRNGPVGPILTPGQMDILQRRGINPISLDVTQGQPSVITELTTAIAESLQPLHVQRFYNYLVRRIRLNLAWTFLEPQTEDLSLKIIEQVSGFLSKLWEAGALVGTTPQEAFYVKCDSDQERGSMLSLGIAPVVEPSGAQLRHITFRLPQFLNF